MISAQALLLIPNQRLPYNTSVLTGQGWVGELLDGHPECIHCELGMHKETFMLLISELHNLGYSRLKYVSIEEQLVIFLYMCNQIVYPAHRGTFSTFE